MANLTTPLRMNSGHESQCSSDVGHQFLESVDRAEPIAKADRGCRNPGQRFPPRAFIPDRPCGEPAIDCSGCALIHFVRYGIREQGKLEAPSLNVLVAGVGVGELVPQIQFRAAVVRSQANCDP